MKVLFLTNVPSPYRVLFFNELGTKCDLTVLYQKKGSSERNDKWVEESKDTYKSVFMRGRSARVDNAFCLEVIKYIDKSYDAIIICGISSPTEILAIEWCRLNKIRYCIEGDGAFAKYGNGIKEKLKRHLICGGSLFFSTCEEHDKYYEHYGADPSRVYKYRFSSLLAKDILEEEVTKSEKFKLREELGMKHTKIILAVGQFIYRKGFDVLLKSAVHLSDKLGIYIVGDEPTKEYLNIVRVNKLKNVHFVGFKTKDELKKYYKAADAFVLPTREDIWGLVINEAMAYGLPVVTTNRCNAGLELIQNGVNGYLISTDSVFELREAMIKAVQESEELGRNSLKIIKDYTIETMVDDHISALKLNK